MNHIIYLHGFLSSPKSEKAQLVLKYLSSHHPSIKLHMPTLSGNSDKAVEAVDEIVQSLLLNKDTPSCNLRFIGSSMGGFLATYFVENYGGKAVLINPAVEPFNLIEGYMGQHINPYTNEVFTIDGGSVEKLLQLHRNTKPNNVNYLVYLQTKDETLDYRLAEVKYGSNRCVIEAGGNHSFIGLENHLGNIIEFLLQD